MKVLRWINAKVSCRFNIRLQLTHYVIIHQPISSGTVVSHAYIHDVREQIFTINRVMKRYGYAPQPQASTTPHISVIGVKCYSFKRHTLAKFLKVHLSHHITKPQVVYSFYLNKKYPISLDRHSKYPKWKQGQFSIVA